MIMGPSNHAVAMAQSRLSEGPATADFREFMRIHQSYAEVACDTDRKTSFVLLGKVKTYLEEGSRARLSTILDEIFAPDRPPVDGGTILDKSVVVFCILVDIGLGHAIHRLVQYAHYHDNKLPFDASHQPKGWPADTISANSYERFCEKQWKFCPAIFERNMEMHFEPQHVLPFMTKKLLTRGGMATLYKITLYPAYNNLLRSQSTGQKGIADVNSSTFVLKTYTGPDSQAYFTNEVKAFQNLRTVRNSPTSNVIGFYGSYTQGPTYNLILEFADRGSLEDYFCTEPPCEAVEIEQFWTGLMGIVRGLDSIQGIVQNPGNGEPTMLNGWHQDVKPGNILVVSNDTSLPYGCQFKLADFGVSHFKKKVGKGKAITSDDSQGTVTYGAPECWRYDDYWDFTSIQVDLKVDIWSLGCVFSEAAVWMGKGHKGLLQYRADRAIEARLRHHRLGDCFHDGEKALRTVSDWHNSLLATLRTGDHITPEVLKMVGEHMLLESPECRLNTRQLLGRVPLMLKGQYATGISNGVGSQHRLSTSPRQPTELPPNPKAPPQSSHWPNGTWSGSHTHQSSSRSGTPSRIMSGARVSSPDRLSHIDDLEHEFTSTNTRRPVTQPQFDADRRGYETPPLSRDSYQSQRFEEVQSARDGHFNCSLDSVLKDKNGKGKERAERQSFIGSKIKTHQMPKKCKKIEKQANLPHLTLATAINWRNTKKWNADWVNRYRKKTLAPLTGDWELLRVGKRDHVFIIDDASSMKDVWDEMCTLFGMLAYLVKKSDKDGIDMYFTMSNEKHNDTNTSRLVEIVRKMVHHLQSESNINSRLDDILMEYNKKLKKQINLRNHRSTEFPVESLKPLSIYVFTNGHWTERSDPKPAITSIVESLVALGQPASQVGIQFITFGSNEEWLQRLKEYDSGLGLKLDIVDTTPSNGNLWKMILGATIPAYDETSEEEDYIKEKDEDD